MDMSETIEQPIITEHVDPQNMKRLMAAVIEQTLRDLTGKSTPAARKIDAFLFLTSGMDFEDFLDWAGTPHLDPYRDILPNLRSIQKRLRGGGHPR